MFDINKIYSNIPGRFLCNCICDSAQIAENYVARFLMPVREACFLADLYSKGSTLIIDTPDKETTMKSAYLLNKSINNI